MDPEYRIKQYIGNLHNDVIIHKKNLKLDSFRGITFYCFNDYKEQSFPTINGTYYHDMTRYVSFIPTLHNSRFLFFVGDTSVKYDDAVIVKTRPFFDFGNAVLMDLDHPRHFNSLSVVNEKDVLPYEQKKDILFWRGATTGPGFDEKPHPRHTSRAILASEYGRHENQHLDIGLSNMTNTVKESSKGQYYSQFVKPSISLPDMFSYKFHLSVEGHDVATNLKWILYSNSVPFCPPFYVQSWILENELVPWTHYIPLHGDYSDLEEKVEWAIGHPDVCSQIAREGHQYMEQFLDLEKEAMIRQHVLEHYTKHVKII